MSYEMQHEYKLLTIYIDDFNNIIVLPCGESKKYGGTVEIDLPQSLSDPFSLEELEHILLKSLELCYTKFPDEDSNITALEKTLNVKGYAKAVKTRRLIHVEWDKSSGYLVIPTQKVPKRGYVHLTEHSIKVSENYTENQLAEAVNQAISKSI